MLKQKLISKLKLQQINISTNSGFTLIESLVAAVVVGILLVSIAPMLVISTASRIQARRVDSANNLARDFADRLKAGVIPPFPPNVFTVDRAIDSYEIVPRYDGTLNSISSVTKNITAYDGNGDGAFDGANDFVIQAIRSPDRIPNSATVPNLDANTPANLRLLQNGGYDALIRVYRGDAFTYSATGSVNLPVSSSPFTAFSNLSTTNPGNPDIGRDESMTSELQSTFTGGTGNNSKHKPLAIFRTTVQYNVNFTSLRTRLGP